MLDAAVTPRLTSHQQATGHASLFAPTPSGSRLGTHWFVVSTYAQAERRAARNLADQGYQTYLPLVAVLRRDRVLRTMTHRIEVPLFPAYLFIRFDLRDPWRPITNTPGVFKLLTNAGHSPEPVPDAAVSAVRAAEALRRSQPPDNARIAPGDAVCLRKGYVWAGLPAVVTSVHRETHTADIAVMFLGQLRTISVDLDCLAVRDE